MALIESGKEFDKEKHQEKMKKKLQDSDSTLYTLKIPSALYKKVKRKLIDDSTNLRAVIVEYLYEYVKK